MCCGPVICYDFSGCCSECVGAAACNNTFCGSCLTGSVATADCCAPEVTAGSDAPICTPVACDACKQETCACSPDTCGTSDQPPATCAACNTSAPRGGGSGMGSAGSSGGAKPLSAVPATCQLTKLGTSLAKLGTSLTSLLTGGRTVAATTVLPGQKVAVANPSNPISSNTFLLVIVIVGALLLMLSFSKGEGD